MTTFLAIDPGSYQMGVSIFVDGRLKAYDLLGASGAIENRIVGLLTAVDAVAFQWPELTQVACERVTALKERTPSPELATLIRRLRQWARSGYRYPGRSEGSLKTHKFAWFEYHPSTVVAAVRPRGVSVKAHKTLLRLGVTLLYGYEPGIEDFDQNIIDSIAVGHCHLSKTWEDDLVAGRKI